MRDPSFSPNSRSSPSSLPMDPRIRGLLLFVVVGGVAAEKGLCSRPSLAESVLGGLGSCSSCGCWGEDGAGGRGWDLVGVTEADETGLNKALHQVHKNRGDYVALLFYASWCPFSKICRPNFDSLALSFPNIRHFAFEEASVRPSTLSKCGVHGFPTLFLLNSTVRVRYHGPRTVSSLVSFYSIVTGNSPMPLDPRSLEKAVETKLIDVELENCPFSWARSPEKLLQQDTYLALATAFILARLLYFLAPKLGTCIHRAWRRHIRYASLVSLLQICLEQARQASAAIYCSKPQHRGINASEWASKSLASVSLGESSTGRVLQGREMR